MTELGTDRPETTPGQAPEERSAPQEGYESNDYIGLLFLFALLGLLWVRAGWEYVVIVAAIIVMIFLHELGHYVAARRGGMRVTEFFLGFGPRIWSFKKGETEYGIKAIPAGAYVKIPGMNNLEEVEPEHEGRTYRQQSFPKRLAVAVAGSAMHFLIAFVCIYALAVGWGTQGSYGDWSVAETTPDAPAAEMGMLPGDVIVAINGETLPTWPDVQDWISDHPGEDVAVTVQRDGAEVTLDGRLEDNDGSGRIGIRADAPFEFEPESVVGGIPEAAKQFGTGVQGTLSGIAHIVSPAGISDLLGTDDGETTATGSGGGTEEDEGRVISIVGATRIGAEAVEGGVPQVLWFVFVLNMFIGVFNLMPLLPLDGGHVVIAVYERIRELAPSVKGRYYADANKMLPLAWAVVLFLVFIGGVSIFRDITDPVNL